MTDMPAELTAETIRTIFNEEMGKMRVQWMKDISDTTKDFVTGGTVAQMIATALEPIRVRVDTEIKSVDNHLRQAEADLKDARRSFERAADNNQAVTREMAQAVGALNAVAQATREQSEKLEQRFNDHEKQANADRMELTGAIRSVEELHLDIHGDPDKPHVVSLYQLIEALQAKMLEGFGEIKEIAVSVERHEKFIRRWNAISSFAIDQGREFWQNKRTRAAFIGVISFFVYLEIGSNTPLGQGIILFVRELLGA